MRFSVYIDGYNLYYGLREAAHRDPFYKRCYWLNLIKLGSWLEALNPDWTLHKVKYFTARELEQKSARTPGKSNQARYLEALRAVGVEIVEGYFRKETLTCRNEACGKFSAYIDLAEKMTDVGLGVHIVSDCLRREVDGFVLVTRDADQIPSLNMVSEHREGVLRCLAFPPRRGEYPRGLMKAASAKRAQGSFDSGHLIRESNTMCIGLTPDILGTLRLPPVFHEKAAGPKTKQTHSEPEDWDIGPNLRASGPTIKFLDANLLEGP